jgi:hypothetical protein
VDTDGGTCVDNASPVTYSSATACSSIDAANDTCDNGDTVLVKGGSYGTQIITGGNGRTSACTVAPATGETAALSAVQVGSSGGNNGETADGAKFLTINADMRMTSTSDFLIQGDTSDFTLDDFDGSIFFIRGALRQKDNITITGGDWGPCEADDTSSNCNLKIDGSVTDVLIDGIYAHNLECSGHNCTDCTDGTPACDIHLECMIVFRGLVGFTVRNSKFHDCELMDIFFQQGGCGGIVGGEGSDGCPQAIDTSDVTIENNWFGQPYNGQGSKVRPGAVVLDGSGSTLTDFLIRGNSFENGTGIDWNVDRDATTYSQVRGIGNIDGLSGTGFACNANWSVTYTVYAGASACSGTGNVARNATPPYVSGTGNSSMDFHLSGATTSIDDLVPATGENCPTTDYDGTSRPQATNCDAGADER